jgi:hypothetical protein
MKFKTLSNQLSEKKPNSRLRKRRAVAEVISTMMLMGVTITGASTLTYFVNDGFVSGNLESVRNLDPSYQNISLLAYDTRDSYSLLSLANVDNENLINKFLCGGHAVTGTCGGSPNAIPDSGGTEFIVLQIHNYDIDSIFLEDIAINNVIHSWDPSTSNVPLDAEFDCVSCPNRPYPADGMFSIFPVGNNPTQNESIQIQSGQTVNLLIKLGSDDSDIQLNRGIHVRLDTGKIHTVDFFIETGDAR